MADPEVKIRVSADTRDAEKGLGGLRDTLGNFAKTAGTAALGLAGLAVGGIAALGGAIASTIGPAAEAQAIMAQLDSVLKSTGEAAAKSAKEYADAQGKTVTTTRLSADAIADLTTKLEALKLKHKTSGAAIDEQKQRVIALTEQYGAQGLATKTAQSKLEEMEAAYAKQGGAIDDLTTKIAKGGEKVTTSLVDKMKLAPPVVQMTKDELIKLADSLSKVTPFEDDLIISTETMLLQFKNIGEDVFPKATEMALDLATRLGIDAPSAAKLLGKALEEPGEGLARLKQAGIAFSDEQTAMILKMAESGDVAGAQKLIMDELATSIGGAAQAAGDTFSGKMEILKNTFGNLKESIGTAFLPVLTQLADKFTAFITDNAPQITAFFQGLADWISNKLIPAFIEVWNWLATNLPPAIAALSEFWTTTLQPALAAIWEFIVTSLIPALVEIWNWLATNIPPAIQALADFWRNTLQPALQVVWAFIQDNVIPILQTVFEWLKVHVPLAIQTLADFWRNTLQPALKVVWEFIQDKVIPILKVVFEWLKTNIPPALKALSDMWTDTLQPALKAVWSFIQDNVIPIFKALLDLGIAVVQKGVEILAAFWTNVLKPALEKVWLFLRDNIIPIFQSVMEWIGHLVGSFDWLRGWIGTIRDAFDWIREAIQTVIHWIEKLIDMINNLELPAWLTGASPPPLAYWLGDISKATKELAQARLPELQAQLRLTGGVKGIEEAATAINNNYNLTIHSSAPAESAVADFSVMRALAGV